MSIVSWMVKQRLPDNARSISGLDIILILACFLFVQWMYLHKLDFTAERSVLMFSVLFFSYILFAAFGLYRVSSAEFMHQLIMKLTVAWVFVGLLAALVLYLSKVSSDVSRVWFGVSMTLSYVALVSVRLISSALLAKARMQGRSIQPVVLISEGNSRHEITKRLSDNPWTGYRIAKTFTKCWSSMADDESLTSAIQEVHQHIEQQRQKGSTVSEVWIRLPLSAEQVIKRIVTRLQDSSVDVCLLPDNFAMQVLSGAASNVASLPVVNISKIRLPLTAELFKRMFDRPFAFVALLFFSPIMLAIVIAIKLDSPGSVLFRQTRYGIDGREIEVWKFRSMSVQENGADVRQVVRNDPRVTRIGAFLRRSSLDELPQFYNVLQGRMSVVGPRPHPVVHNEAFRGQIDGYMLRHKIKPGITGWAQVNGWRGETETLDKMENRIKFDLEYIQNWSVWLDMKIIVLTVLRGFYGKNAY